MKMSPLLGIILLSPAGLSACGDQSRDTWPAPEKGEISSILQKGSGNALIVVVTSSGGGAGDITHRLLDCKTGSEKCELLAGIDTNDAPPPTLSDTKEGVALIVSKSDYVADFRNFSRELGSLQPGELYLQYRNGNGG